jgi:hypothetical protein
MSCKVTHDTSSVEEDKISLSAFQHCLHCKGAVTEAFLDAVLESHYPEVLTSFKVSPFCHSYIPPCLIFVSGIHFELLLHATLLRGQSLRSVLLRHRPCRSSRKFRNCMLKLLQNYHYRKHENGSVSQSVAAPSESESWGLPALVAILGCGVFGSLFYNAL